MYYYFFAWFFSCTLVYGFNFEDEVNLDSEINKSQENAINWLFSMQDREGGWGLHHPETHRILTSLSLSLSNFNYTQNNNLRYQKGVKKLIYEITSYVKCNEISSGQLALYANALMATCQNIHDYHDLITRMKQKKKLSSYERGLVSLSICIAGYRVQKEDLQYYLKLLKNQNSNCDNDARAVIVMALICVKNSHKYYCFLDPYIQKQLNSFKNLQTHNGSFGNVYTSALIVQALIASKDSEDWSFRNSIDYFLSEQKNDGSFNDLLATYFILPILSGHSLLDIKNITCQKDELDIENSEIAMQMQNTSIEVRYSLNDKNISNFFIVPENSTFLDVMKIAQTLDCSYSFKGIEYSWGYFIQEIGGIPYDNDGMLYKIDEGENFILISTGVDKEYPMNDDHYIFGHQNFQLCEERNFL